MAALQFGVPFFVVATNSTLSTVVGVQSPANQRVKIMGMNIGCDGTNSAQGPAIAKMGQCTMASNAPGTNSTVVTLYPLDQDTGETIQSVGGKAWTTQPTVITYSDGFNVPVYMGSAIIFRPLTSPAIAKGGSGWNMSITQQSGVSANVSGSLTCEE